MNCSDMLEMKEIKEYLQVFAGEKGLDRQIRWIYFADSMWWEKESFDPFSFIHGGELIFAINVMDVYTEEKLLELMRVSNQKNVAGYVVDEDKVTENMIQCAQELSLPLFGINEKLKLVDFSLILCKVLVEEMNEQSLGNLLSTLLYDNQISKEEIIYKSEQYGLELEKMHRIMTVRFESSNHSDAELVEKSKEIQRLLKKEVKNFGVEYVFLFVQKRKAVILLPSDIFQDEVAGKLGNAIIEKLKKTMNLTGQIGIGNGYAEYEKWKVSYQEAKNALNMADHERQVVFYNQLGIYGLLMQVHDERYLKKFYQDRIGAMIKYDSVNNSNLCDTLEKYIKCNCNANAAADELFIHRNTMRYRMDKIENLLKCNLGNIEACTELNIALNIRKYLEKREGSHLE